MIWSFRHVNLFCEMIVLLAWILGRVREIGSPYYLLQYPVLYEAKMACEVDSNGDKIFLSHMKPEVDRTFLELVQSSPSNVSGTNIPEMRLLDWKCEGITAKNRLLSTNMCNWQIRNAGMFLSLVQGLGTERQAALEAVAMGRFFNSLK
jgi:hypothetical protein